MSEEGRRPSNTVWIIVAVVLLALLLLCGCLSVMGAGLWLFPFRTVTTEGFSGVELPRLGLGPEATRTEARAFPAEPGVLVEIVNDVGPVRVEGVAGNMVTAEATIRAYGATAAAAEREAEEIELQMAQRDDGSVLLRAQFPRQIFQGRSPNVSFVVRVPRNAHIVVRNNVGEVEIRNIEGVVEATTDVGEVRVQNLTMTGDCQITSNVGRIRVGLPSDASFLLDAATDVGDINTDFAVERTQDQRPGVGRSIQGPVGSDPEYTLRLRTDTGSIDITEE